MVRSTSEINVAKKTSKRTTKKTTLRPRGKPTRAGSAKSEMPARNGSNGGPMDMQLLERLMSLMSHHGVTSIDLQEGSHKIVLSRGTVAVATAAADAPPPAAMTSAAATAPSAAAAPVTDTSGLVEIVSPMVGTFYVSSSPDAKPFVSIGSKVGPDTDVCIIEAMKVFNSIKAETSGTVERVLAENGQAVEYGQPLFLLKPS